MLQFGRRTVSRANERVLLGSFIRRDAWVLGVLRGPGLSRVAAGDDVRLQFSRSDAATGWWLTHFFNNRSTQLSGNNADPRRRGDVTSMVVGGALAVLVSRCRFRVGRVAALPLVTLVIP